jgi:hypothetical protein
MEREPVRGARADARKPRQLGDEILDRRAQHADIVPARRDGPSPADSASTMAARF